MLKALFSQIYQCRAINFFLLFIVSIYVLSLFSDIYDQLWMAHGTH